MGSQEATILFKTAHPVDISSFDILLNSKFNRQPLPSDLEENIGTIWDERRRTNPSLWNGSKFRLGGYEQGEKNILHLGLTDYRDYLGTNWSPRVKELRELGIKHHENAQAHLSDPLGVAAFLVTRDNLVVLLCRSSLCAEAQNLFDCPGGHPEPAQIFGSNLDIKTIPPHVDSSLVVSEIFNSILKEIRDEVNLPPSSLSAPLFLGVALNSTSAFRPAAQFYVQTTLMSEEVKALYSKATQAEANESTKIIFVAKEELLKGEEGLFWDQLAPNAKGCIMLAKELNI